MLLLRGGGGGPRQVGQADPVGLGLAPQGAQDDECAGKAAADLGITHLAQQREGGGRRPCGGVLGLLDLERGATEEIHDLGLGHLLDGVEDEHDVVTQRLYVFLIEGRHDAVGDLEAALGESEVPLLLQLGGLGRDHLHDGADQLAETQDHLAHLALTLELFGDLRHLERQSIETLNEGVIHIGHSHHTRSRASVCLPAIDMRAGRGSSLPGSRRFQYIQRKASFPT